MSGTWQLPITPALDNLLPLAVGGCTHVHKPTTDTHAELKKKMFRIEVELKSQCGGAVQW